MSENNNEYDHIDFRINVLYDVVYSQTQSPYILHPIVKSSITLLDIKMPDSFDPLHIFSEKLDYMGKYNNKLSYKRTSDASHPCTLTFGRYHGLGNVNDLGRSEVYNPTIHYLLSELVINEKFKHVLLPIMFFDVTLGDLKNYSKKIYDDIMDDSSLNQNATDQSKIHIFATEHYFKMQTLREYIKEEFYNLTPLHWKVIIFQVFFTLYKIQERLQKFRHNMLNLDSIKLYRKKEGGDVQYKVGQTVFNVPNLGFEIKFSDFMYSSTADNVRNKDTRLIQENPYYDIHYFMCCLYLYTSKELGKFPESLGKFFTEMVPTRFVPALDALFEGLNEQEFDTVSSQIIVPANTLKKNNFFSEFIAMDFSASPAKNERINVKDLNNKESGVDYTSLTEESNDVPNMLAKKISNNKKKSGQYYNKDMIKGSRKIIVSGFENNSESENGIFEKAEKAERSEKMERSKSKKVSDKKEKKDKKKKSSKTLKRENGNSPSDNFFDERHVELAKQDLINKVYRENNATHTIELSDSTSAIGGSEVEKEAEKFILALKEIGKRAKEKRREKKREKKGKKVSKKQKRISEDSASLSSLEESEKTESVTSISESEVNNINKNLERLDKNFADKLKNVPNNYFGQVPDHIAQHFDLGGFNNQIPAEGMGLIDYPQQMQMMPQNLSQGMPGMLPQNMHQPMIPQGMPGMLPQIPQSMPGILPQGMPHDMQIPGTGLPMLPQGMPGMSNMPGVMMGGGNKKEPDCYFVKDGKKVEVSKDDFFF